MFKELGALMNLMNNRGKLQEEVAKFQQATAQLSTEGAAGGGMVTVKVNGRQEVLKVGISDEAWKQNDREMLEDLVAAATNQALGKIRELVAAETAKMAANMGLPAGALGGLGLPGM